MESYFYLVRLIFLLHCSLNFSNYLASRIYLVWICIVIVHFFWQRIKEGSVIDRIQIINVGDMIESINGQSLIGCRHYEVAKMLKDLPKGHTFNLKLTEPRKAFDMISQRSKGGKNSGCAQLGTGRGTLRLRAKGPATVEEQVCIPGPQLHWSER
uniref:PDZ domain-containing protein n=1 Tax=Micrurus spixii TaxID=129469 RepID=A0A2D4NDG8_9SAUR